MNNELVQEIFVEDIIPNRFQPRLTFDEKALQELADSIKIHGVIQPLVLRKVGNKYEIIAGERRYKASQMAGLKKVPAIVREMTDNESAEVALIENLQRKNLSSIEEAQSFKSILERGYLTQEELAKKLGISQSTIANKMRLLNLCQEVQDALLNEKISERHARSLLSLKNVDAQKSMLQRIIDERLTVKQLDNEIKKMNNKSESDDTISQEANKFIFPEDNTKEMSNRNVFGFNSQPVEPVQPINMNPNLQFTESSNIEPINFNPFTSTPVQTSFEINVPIENDKEEAAPSSEIETFSFGEDIANTNVEGEVVQDAPNLLSEVENLRNQVRNIEQKGFKVEFEEYDFEDMYQIIIKIKK